MSEIWMFDGPRDKIPKRAIYEMIKANDCHKWQVGFEEGSDGYRHYQGRLVSSNDNYFEWCKAHIPALHVEKAEKWSNYERKSGRFIASDDFIETWKTRFGTPNQKQREVINWMKQQGVREIDFWYDPNGFSGKSWIINHLWELGGCHYIRPKKNADRIVADLCSKMEQDRRPYVMIDIPRAGKVTDDLVEALESIKDGLIDDDRYTGTTINVRGVKILVMTNNKIANLSKLSKDRVFVNGKRWCDGKTRKQLRKSSSFLQRIQC